MASAAAAVDGRLHGASLPFTRIVSDSRDDCNDSLFVALRGDRFDGHNYIKAAANKGAVGVLACNTTTALPHISVQSTTRALVLLGKYNRQRSQAKICCVTGSSGKTTICNMLHSILRTAAGDKQVHATRANHNNEIGVAQTLLDIAPSHHQVVVEMGARRPGDIAWLTKIAQPTTSLISSIGHSHLELMPSLDAVAREKSSIFAPSPEHRPDFALAPVQAVQSFRLFDGLDGSTIPLTFGLASDGADAALSNLALTANQSQASLSLPATAGRKATMVQIRIKVSGAHQLHNAAGAALTAWVNGIDTAAITRGLVAYSSSPGRQYTQTRGNLTLINDCYNANPDSTAAALACLALYHPAVSLAILGDMLELGQKSTTLHQQIGKQAAQLGINCLITYGTQAKLLGASYQQHLPQGKWQHFSDQPTLIKHLSIQIAHSAKRKEIAVLVKGSRGMHMESIVEAIASLSLPLTTRD